MEMSACEVPVIGDLGKNVWHKIGRSEVGAVIELRANTSEARRERDEIADKLIGVFNAYSHSPMFVGVIGDAELGSPSVRHSNGEVLILIIGNSQIDRHWADAGAVGRQPTPRLSAE